MEVLPEDYIATLPVRCPDEGSRMARALTTAPERTANQTPSRRRCLYRTHRARRHAAELMPDDAAPMFMSERGHGSLFR